MRLRSYLYNPMVFASTVRASAWLLQAVATRPDTVVTRQIVERGGFDQLTHVAAGILTLLLLLLVLLAFPAAWYFRNRLQQLTLGIEGLRRDLGPLVERSRGVMQNAEEISLTIKRDVARLSETVGHFDGQLREISDIAADRIRDFDALLGAVQEEAEELFLTAASATRGVRAGVRALRRHRARRDRREALPDEQDADDADDAELDVDVDADAPEADGGADAEPRPRAPRLHRRRHAT